MYLLYIDESGNESDPKDRHFVLAGAAVFERNTFFLAQELDAVQTRHFPGLPPIPFHASHIRSGTGFWRRIEQQTRERVLEDIANVIADANDPGMFLFGAVIEKTNLLWGEKAVEYATEQICKRFDTLLMQRYQESNDPQRGLIIFSEGRFEKRARLWVQGFRELGTRWGFLRNLSDIPYFAAMRETRLLQLADFVSHSLFLLYERRDPQLIIPFILRFHQKDGILHGIVHCRSDRTGICECPACTSRTNPYSLGPWIPTQERLPLKNE
jgi:hypothetical protein